MAAAVSGRKKKKNRGRGRGEGRRRKEGKRRDDGRRREEGRKREEGRGREGKGGRVREGRAVLDYTVIPPGGEEQATTEVVRWRGRLRELQGRSGEEEGRAEVKERSGEEGRVRRESVEPIYSSEHRIAWLCGDPSRNIIRCSSVF